MQSSVKGTATAKDPAATAPDSGEATHQAARDFLVVGLRNAHALEKQTLTVHRQQLGQLDDYPPFKTRLQQHIAETEAQVTRLERALERLGEKPSTLKDTSMQLAGWVQSATQMTADDRVVKAAVAAYGVKGFELASYRALERLAAMVDDEATRADVRASLAEEKSMTEWLDAEIGNLTAAYIERTKLT
jgi:ferritin-like metal-binding protein YciE